ncbi:MAG: hypothetical protein HY231_03540 [Acidobacteria bacterium]|nr:hypothetical protein [Acidobacteriota bacterium]
MGIVHSFVGEKNAACTSGTFRPSFKAGVTKSQALIGHRTRYVLRPQKFLRRFAIFRLPLIRTLDGSDISIHRAARGIAIAEIAAYAKAAHQVMYGFMNQGRFL